MPQTTPITPPISQSTMASMMNCVMMLRFLAPTARRIPISRVRSVTETSMMFMMPMPAASKAIELTTTTPMRTVSVKVLNWAINESLEAISKLSGSPGGTLRIMRKQAAHFLDAGLIARAVAGLDQDGQAAPDVAEAVKAGGKGDDRELVLVAAQRAAFGLEHPDDGVIQAVNLHPFADRLGRWERWSGPGCCRARTHRARRPRRYRRVRVRPGRSSCGRENCPGSRHRGAHPARSAGSGFRSGPPRRGPQRPRRAPA